jgi:hypothetical protein
VVFNTSLQNKIQGTSKFSKLFRRSAAKLPGNGLKQIYFSTPNDSASESRLVAREQKSTRELRVELTCPKSWELG